MIKSLLFTRVAAVLAGLLGSVTCASALTITQTTDGTALATALGGTGLTINSVTIDNGAPAQFGTYTGFTSPPVTIGNGVVLSTGNAVQTTAAFHSAGNSPSTALGQPGTTEFNNYGPGHITNFSRSNDVAALHVNFTLNAPTQVGFDFAFGSVEFPQFTSRFTDAFLAFLDGTGSANQIVFDASGNAVQVGTTFAGALTTADTNTAFSAPHGIVRLQTFTMNQLSAGNHSLIFQLGDTNDGILDSGVFISDFRAGQGTGGTTPTIPEPASLALFVSGLMALGAARWLKRLPS
jgi:hypothetical protein